MLDHLPSKFSSIDSCDFSDRHIGLSSRDETHALKELGYESLEEFIDAVVPAQILEQSDPEDIYLKGCSEQIALDELFKISQQNQLMRSLIGLGYHESITPAAIQRHVLENPAWYTAYTPYQAEISQGRLEALFNFQTLITELTGLPIANASLLDEATAAAEGMSLCFASKKNQEANCFFVDELVFPQTLAVLRTRAEPLDIELKVASPDSFVFDRSVFGAFIQLPGSNGKIWDPSSFIDKSHDSNVLVVASIDPLAQVLMQPLGELGVDIAVGSVQRLGLPVGYGGPHAAFFATREIFKRQVPGRIVGQSIDSEGKSSLRLALQTREQHIRRDKATSNICTSQALLAIISSFYAVHHGPEGLERIAGKVVYFRAKLEAILVNLGYTLEPLVRFDSIDILSDLAPEVHRLAVIAGFNLRILPLGSSIDKAKGFGISFDELSTENDVTILSNILSKVIRKPLQNIEDISKNAQILMPGVPLRKSPWLLQDVFHSFRSETELLRYITRLCSKDFSLVHGMIPLGSCTMKLNAAAELLPISWKELSSIHPFAPKFQAEGYQKLINDLEDWLSFLTGFAGVSLQPNAGSQGELAGLLVIRAWHQSRGDLHRNICLIPTSAHGTNPASAVMAGFDVIPVACDEYGNVDLSDLSMKASANSSRLGALMVTYPSTHGVFEPKIGEICDVIHNHGGQVYLDGANLNAQVGLCKPGNYGADVCHLNLHKTFCIPHGGGGPGVGPIAVASHLVPYLPNHPLHDFDRPSGVGAISAAPFGSAGILPISWMYLRMMGLSGLQKASSIAMLSANYVAHRLNPFYPVLYRGLKGLVAHECILDLRPLKRSVGIEVDDIAKRLMDYGFHAPTVSWPVAGTLMVEPTESESLQELDRFCDAMIAIRQEIRSIEEGESDLKNNLLKNAPHTLDLITSDSWERPYSRSQAAFPTIHQRKSKFWPAVSRIDNAFGDRNLVCTCSGFQEESQ